MVYGGKSGAKSKCRALKVKIADMAVPVDTPYVSPLPSPNCIPKQRLLLTKASLRRKITRACTITPATLDPGSRPG